MKRTVLNLLLIICLLLSTVIVNADVNADFIGEEEPDWLKNMTEEERINYGKKQFNEMKKEFVKIYLEQYTDELSEYGVDVYSISNKAINDINEVDKLFKDIMEYKMQRRLNVEDQDMLTDKTDSSQVAGPLPGVVTVTPLLAYDGDLEDICRRNGTTAEEYMIAQTDILSYYYNEYFGIQFNTDRAPAVEWLHGAAGFQDLGTTYESQDSDLCTYVASEFPTNKRYKNSGGRYVLVDMVFAFAGPNCCGTVMGRVHEIRKDVPGKHLWLDTWGNATGPTLMHEVGHLYDARHCGNKCFMEIGSNYYGVCNSHKNQINDNREKF